MGLALFLNTVLLGEAFKKRLNSGQKSGKIGSYTVFKETFSLVYQSELQKGHFLDFICYFF